ncbi:histone H3.v1-like isoform X2 [Sitophilus oryzae]|uniref:Histone H3.v1-like isoform X2 n=1 Tax=Sitophilus oryzae TaxID=7048 RepID=A0A6J2Y8H7_SITOR|nr:histone H3.v1-like isoform X2 [Sitophilus oryzae]
MTYLSIPLLFLFIPFLCATSPPTGTARPNFNDHQKFPIQVLTKPLEAQTAASSSGPQKVQSPFPIQTDLDFKSFQQVSPKDSQPKAAGFPPQVINFKPAVSTVDFNDYFKYLLQATDASTEASLHQNRLVPTLQAPVAHSALISATSFIPQYLAQSEISISPAASQQNQFNDALSNPTLNLYSVPQQPPRGYNPTHFAFHSGPVGANNIPMNVKFNLPENNFFNQQFQKNKQKFPLSSNIPVRPTAENLQAKPRRPVPEHLLNQQFPVVPFQLPPLTNGLQGPQEFYYVNNPQVNPNGQPQQNEEKPVNEERDENGNENEEEEAEEEEEEQEEDGGEENEEGEEEKAPAGDIEEAFNFETFPFEAGDYVEQKENHQFKPFTYFTQQNKENNEEEENDEENEEETESDASQKNPISYRLLQDQRQSGSVNKEKLGVALDQKTKAVKSPKFYKKLKKYKKKKNGAKKGKKAKGKAPETLDVAASMMMNLEDAPITRKQKVYKERWYVAQDVQDQNNPPKK